ncbi:uncharacterized protein LOC117283054 [Cryptotermes secundus]|uniref:uncharacterized protein LOC117283054 n=1 Tax=Cryptotermes secundus TaxID=105785 RepID=UPI001454D662|nr:uncharacterized protein LOC117283054 [Cryptotermes secundus]
MAQNKQNLRNEILTEVKHQMVLLSQSDDKGSGQPNYSWLSQKPRLTSGQREKLEELTAKIGEAECKTAVMTLRTELERDATVPACDVPMMMCQILQQLVQDHNTANLFRYRNRSTVN